MNDFEKIDIEFSLKWMIYVALKLSDKCENPEECEFLHELSNIVVECCDCLDRHNNDYWYNDTKEVE